MKLTLQMRMTPQIVIELLEGTGFDPVVIHDDMERAVFVVSTFVERFEDGGFEGYLLSSYGNCCAILSWAWGMIGADDLSQCVPELMSRLPSKLVSRDWGQREDYYLTNEGECIEAFQVIDRQFRMIYDSIYGDDVATRWARLNQQLDALLSNVGE